MRNLVFAALPLVVLAAPALAEPTCKGGGAMLPMWQVAKSFEDAGGEIQQMKTTGGCYEIYGHQADARVEIFLDPRTGAEIERE